ncbi:TetR family transcriptional regulator [Pseudomonas putida]|uniref:TetR family transcriptional regulator n=2 Tax=Pseudomonas putida TaxID=303 RepID=A0A7Y7ZER2_PSEPU|nr:TetR family transcriptional regulator [Pseudomonas sp. Snoq117.2]NWC83606.1 TetR family transcriptional regulator [Pseudomonas putida]
MKVEAKSKPADARKRDLMLALKRIEHGRSQTGDKKITIAAVAREAGVSAALIHNHYPEVAEAIRESQGRSSRAQRDLKTQKLHSEREKVRALREEIAKLQYKISKLTSLNEVLMIDNKIMKAKQNDDRIITITSKKD